jgi:hypothetical protein
LAIIERVGHGRVGRPQRRQMIGAPAGRAAAQRIEATEESIAPEPLHRLAGRAPPH